jgi:hypothetical protein
LDFFVLFVLFVVLFLEDLEAAARGDKMWNEVAPVSRTVQSLAPSGVG